VPHLATLPAPPAYGYMHNVYTPLLLSNIHTLHHPLDAPRHAQVAECTFLNNKLVEVVAFMENISLKDSAEKDAFFKRLPAMIPAIPEPVAIRKVLPLLSNALEYGGAPPTAVSSLLLIGRWAFHGHTDKGMLSDSTGASSHVVLPHSVTHTIKVAEAYSTRCSSSSDYCPLAYGNRGARGPLLCYPDQGSANTDSTHGNMRMYLQRLSPSSKAAGVHEQCPLLPACVLLTLLLCSLLPSGCWVARSSSGVLCRASAACLPAATGTCAATCWSPLRPLGHTSHR